MIKPHYLKPGDRIAVVSLSSGMLGEECCSHSLEIGRKRMEEFGLTPVYAQLTERGGLSESISPKAGGRFEAGFFGYFHPWDYCCNRRG